MELLIQLNNQVVKTSRRSESVKRWYFPPLVYKTIFTNLGSEYYELFTSFTISFTIFLMVEY